jgi:hypothetical protein
MHARAWHQLCGGRRESRSVGIDQQQLGACREQQLCRERAMPPAPPVMTISRFSNSMAGASRWPETVGAGLPDVKGGPLA